MLDVCIDRTRSRLFEVVLVGCRRIDNGEQLPGFHNDGEYSEHAFEAWLRDAAIMPAVVMSSPSCMLLWVASFLCLVVCRDCVMCSTGGH